MSEALQRQFDWYSTEIDKARADLKKKRADFLDADAKVSALERDRYLVWKDLLHVVGSPLASPSGKP